MHRIKTLLIHRSSITFLIPTRSRRTNVRNNTIINNKSNNRKMEIGMNTSKKDLITQAIESMYPEQSETHRDRKKDFQKTVVFMCDVQECFRPSIDAFDGVVRSSKILIESAKIFNWPVFATEQVPSKLGRTAEEVLQCMRETHPENEEKVVKEKFPIAKSDFGMLRAILMGKDGDLNVQPNSLCGKESLAKMMYDADEIRVLLLGVEAHVCVYQTVKQIMEHNEKAGRNILKPFVLCDGVQSQRGVDREVALEKMKELGATMTTTEMFLFEEMGGAEHENFRDVAKTVRKYK